MGEAIKFRFARRGGVSQIPASIKELTGYEGMLDQVIAMEELLTKWLFEKEKIKALLGSCGRKTMGFASFPHNFSTFLGRGDIYLENLYVCPEYRGRGCDKAFLMQLVVVAVGWGCDCLEWWCLDWNKPNTDFRLDMGAKVMSDWIMYRIDGEWLQGVAGRA